MDNYRCNAEGNQCQTDTELDQEVRNSNNNYNGIKETDHIGETANSNLDRDYNSPNTCSAGVSKQKRDYNSGISESDRDYNSSLSDQNRNYSSERFDDNSLKTDYSAGSEYNDQTSVDSVSTDKIQDGQMKTGHDGETC